MSASAGPVGTGPEDRHEMRDGRLSAAVLARGAELCSLRHAEAELLWDAGPAWPRHSPVLFPIVGRLREDTLRRAGRAYRLTQHGFARDRGFSWLERGPAKCRLALEDDEASRAAFPFPFRLELDYRLEAGRLRIGYRVVNTGTMILPAALGAHPAFRWPLSPAVAPEAHRLIFAQDEPDPVRRLRGGLLLAEPEPTPVRGRELSLSRALFAADALVLDRVRSRSLRYVAPGAAGLEIGWDGFPQLGLWSRDGGEFLCIEPWYGTADPVGFEGDFLEKPGLRLIPPGEAWTSEWWVRPEPA
ncbi:aldose 1-epimerase family protein [Muricoccus radiodurans]|uniref:aldose 1-epimerase family protein n=1 Tax=Muricoccus radiodurans TaxID=2231721 RepID=UPI003CF59467